jgi:hypothetical protein
MPNGMTQALAKNRRAPRTVREQFGRISIESGATSMAGPADGSAHPQ